MQPPPQPNEPHRTTGAHVKGNALHSFKRCVEQRHGAGAINSWTEGLDPSDAGAIQGIILPQTWYPMRLWNHLVDRYVAAFGAGDPQSFRPVAEAIAENDLSTFFKVLLRSASPAVVMERSSSLWERYFDVGTMEAVKVASNRYQVRVSAPRLPTHGPGPVTCGVGVPAWQHRSLVLTGAHDVRTLQTSCRFRNAPVCTFDVSWR